MQFGFLLSITIALIIHVLSTKGRMIKNHHAMKHYHRKIRSGSKKTAILSDGSVTITEDGGKGVNQYLAGFGATLQYSSDNREILQRIETFHENNPEITEELLNHAKSALMGYSPYYGLFAHETKTEVDEAYLVMSFDGDSEEKAAWAELDVVASSGNIPRAGSALILYYMNFCLLNREKIFQGEANQFLTLETINSGLVSYYEKFGFTTRKPRITTGSEEEKKSEVIRPRGRHRMYIPVDECSGRITAKSLTTTFALAPPPSVTENDMVIDTVSDPINDPDFAGRPRSLGFSA